MGILCYLLGRSGSGKSFSMRNFLPEELGVVNVQGKILPFKGSGKFDTKHTDDSAEIVKTIKEMAKKYKSIVVDDFQYVMANEFMRRSDEKGWDKYTDIARHAWDVADCVKDLPADVIVYVMCHTDMDSDGNEKLKTIGKMLDEKIVMEGMSTIVLKTGVTDGHYMFFTQNNGKDTTKSPAGMFPAYAIDNDLKYVDQKIRSYYEIGDFLTEEELSAKDEEVKHDEVEVKPKRRSRRNGSSEEKKEESTEAPEEEEKATDTEPERPKRSRRRAEAEEIAQTGTTEEGGDVPFDAEHAELPSRRRRDTPTEEETPRRRRRRTQEVEEDE